MSEPTPDDTRARRLAGAYVADLVAMVREADQTGAVSRGDHFASLGAALMMSAEIVEVIGGLAYLVIEKALDDSEKGTTP